MGDEERKSRGDKEMGRRGDKERSVSFQCQSFVWLII